MAYKPSPIQRDSVITRAAEEICRLIEGERLSPGDRLPPETRLAEMLGISRNSVREALRILHGLGLVEKLAGKAVVVRAASSGSPGVFDEKVVREAAPIAHQVRMLIVSECAALAAGRISAEELDELEGHLSALHQALNRKDFDGAAQAHEAFHASILDFARNPLLVALYNQASMVRAGAPELSKTLADPLHRKQHRDILDALRDHDAKRAASAVQTHLKTVAPFVEFVARSGTSLRANGAKGADKRTVARRSSVRDPATTT